MSSKKGSKKAGAGKRASKKGGKKKGASKDDKKTQDPKDNKASSTAIELPEHAEFETIMATLKVFPTMYETDVADLKGTWDLFQSLLKERKEAVLKEAQAKVDKAKFDGASFEPVMIDTAAINGAFKRCGTSMATKFHGFERSKFAVSDELLELLANEDKLQYVGGDLTKTKSVKGIKNAIGKVEAQLKQTEPIMQAAKDAVKDISKSSLDEIRALPKPHRLLIKAVQACALLIGTPEKDVSDWGKIRKILKAPFIASLMGFEGTSVKTATVKKIEKDFLGRGNDDMKMEDKLTYENVKKANAVAGSLVKWLEAQLKYNEMLPQVTQKQRELKDLQVQLAMMDGSSADLGNAIKTLEKRVAAGKDKVRTLLKKYEKMSRDYEKAAAQYANEPDLEG